METMLIRAMNAVDIKDMTMTNLMGIAELRK